MSNVKNEEKEELRYIYPEDYKFYEKKVEIVDGKMLMVNGVNTNNVESIDIYMKLFFFYRGREDKKTGISNLKKTRNENKSEFKYFLIGSGLGKIFGIDPLSWFEKERPEVFEDTYTCIILAGMYILKSGKKIDIDIWECLDLLLTAYNENGEFPLSDEQVRNFSSAIMKPVRRKNTRRNTEQNIGTKEIPEMEVITLINEETEKWRINEERRKTLKTYYSIEKKNEIRDKIFQLVLEFEKERNAMEDAYERLSDIKSVPQNKLEFRAYIDRELIRYKIVQEYEKEIEYSSDGKRYMKKNLREPETVKCLNKKYLDEIKKEKEEKNKVLSKDEFEKVKESVKTRDEIKSIIPKVSTIRYPLYMKTFMTIVVKYYKLYPFIPRKTYYWVGKIKFLGNKYVGKALYTQLVQIINLMEAKPGIYEIKNEDALKVLKKYFKFYDKALTQINELDKAVLKISNSSTPEKMRKVEKYVTIYLMEQIFAWDLFHYEYECIKKMIDNGKIEYDSIQWNTLGDYLKTIYKIHGVYTRENVAKVILNTYFQNIKEEDAIKWYDFDTKIDNWIKDQKMYERNILNGIFVDEDNLFMKSKGRFIGDIEDEIIKMINEKLEGNKTSIYYSICISKEEKTSEWINRVIPKDEKERELYKNIIVYSLYDNWEVKKLNI